MTDETWHGTQSGYTYRKCRCEPCRGAHRDRMRKYRQGLYEQGYKYVKGHLREGKPKRKWGT